MSLFFRLGLFAALLVSFARDAFADCSPPRTANAAFERAELVFRGRVQEVRRAGDVVTFDVSRVWKGAVESQFTVHQRATHFDDVYADFVPGLEYLVFANKVPTEKAARLGLSETLYEARACSGTSDMIWAPHYLIDLGSGRAPVGHTRIPDPRTLQ